MNYYRRYSGDYLRDTARLSMIEHGAYTLMLDYYYAEESPLPLDVDEIYTMVRAMKPADRQAVDKVLAKFFTKADDGYRNKRADAEIETSKTARDNGKGGGRPPKNITGSGTGSITGKQTKQETESGTETLTGSVHPPTTNHQPPKDQPPDPNPQPRNTGGLPTCPSHVTPGVWKDYNALRAKKRAPLTQTALDGLQREAGKAGMQLEDAMRMCCERGWISLKADWLKGNGPAAKAGDAGIDDWLQNMNGREKDITDVT